MQETRQIRSTIDYAISKQRTKAQTQDVRAYRDVVCGSDHLFLNKNITIIQTKKNRRTGSKKQNRIDRREKVQFNRSRTIQCTKCCTKEDQMKVTALKIFKEHYHYISECINLTIFQALEIVEGNIGKRNYWWDADIDEKKSKTKN